VSWNGSRFISASTRLQGFFIWRLLVYLLEALLFLLTGLQARIVIESFSEASWGTLLLQGAIISVLVVAVRFVWVYPAAFLTAWLSRSSRPSWQGTFAIAFTGIRGVVSLAAALSIPLTLPSGQPFPERNTVLFVTFCVILTTLLGQGSLLARVFHRLELAGRARREQDIERRREVEARKGALEVTLDRLEEMVRREEVPAGLAQALRLQQENRLDRLRQHHATEGEESALGQRGEVERQLIAVEREWIDRLRRENALGDEARRRIERELDLEEARIVQAGRDPV
jgi:monovalent cation/hydrogen antiporter